MRRAITILTLLLIAAALALAGCGGGGSSSSSSTPSGGGNATTQSSGPTTQSGGGGNATGAVAIDMKNIAFSPKTVTVKVGQKITWTNEDSVPHNVTSKSGAKISSPTFNKGGTFSFTPTKAGTIDYVCTIHPGMEGTIVVKQ
jgi:amicyanin